MYLGSVLPDDVAAEDDVATSEDVADSGDDVSAGGGGEIPCSIG